MKIDLALKEGARFVVNLSLDLKSYCDAYLALLQSQKHFSLLERGA